MQEDKRYDEVMEDASPYIAQIKELFEKADKLIKSDREEEILKVGVAIGVYIGAKELDEQYIRSLLNVRKKKNVDYQAMVESIGEILVKNKKLIAKIVEGVGYVADKAAKKKRTAKI